MASLGRKSPNRVQTADQRAYQQKIKEMRAKSPAPADDTDSTSDDKDREPRIAHVAPEYDLKLFQEAQALASEKIVSAFF
jgi:histone acetyltransferase MYST2